MKSLIIGALAASAFIVPSAKAQEAVDPGFSVSPRAAIHPIVRILFAPIVPLVEIQSGLSPDKASCWNDVPGNVAGCRVAGFIEDIQEPRRDARREALEAKLEEIKAEREEAGVPFIWAARQ